MLQATQYWSHSEKSGVHDFNATNRQSPQIQGYNSADSSSDLQGHLESRQESILRSFLTGSDNLSYNFVQYPISDASCLWKAEERHEMALVHDNPSIPDLADFGFQDLFPLAFDGNGSSPAANVLSPWFIPPNGAADFPTSWPITDSSLDVTDINHQGSFQFPFGGNGHSPAGSALLSSLIPPSGAAGSPTSRHSSVQSPVEPSETRHLSNQDLTVINSQDFSQFPFGGNEHLQSGNGKVLLSSLIVPRGGSGSLTPLTATTALSAQSPLGPSVAGRHTTTEDDLRTVGSPQIQQAAARRRIKNGNYRCPFGNCNATFTELHNLQYHKNAHMGLKPYTCSACKFAAASPATVKRHMKRHQSSCKGSGHAI